MGLTEGFDPGCASEVNGIKLMAMVRCRNNVENFIDSFKSSSLRLSVFLCVFYFTSVACLQAHAQQFTPARLLGMGGTGIAAHSGYQGALLNPATLVEGPQIEGGAYYQDVSGDGETSTLSGVGFLDNGPINFASGAFNYYRWRRRPSSGSKFSSEVFSAALAERFNPVWSLGLGFHLQRNSIANTENNEEKNECSI